MTAAIIWVLILVFFVIWEAVTVQLVSVWFICGAFVAMLTSLLGGSVLLQCIAFFVVSVGALLIFRPMLKAKLTTPMIATNLDMAIGKSGSVVSKINNDEGVGRVNVNGQMWAARSYSGDEIEQGVKIRVYAINGVKLIVYPEVQPIV